MTEKTPKKVFYLITKGNFGGAQRYVFDLATNLPKKDFDVSVIMGQGGTLEKKLLQNGIKAFSLESLGRDVNLWLDCQSLFWIWRKVWQEKPDIIHLNSSKIGGLGALAGRLAGIKKIIFTVHGLAHNEDRPVWQKWLIKLSHWLSMILSHQIITVAKNLEEEIITWPGLANKVITINNGVSPYKLFDRAVARREIWPGHNDKFWIGTIAELHKNKGLDYLIEGFAGTVRSLLGDSLGWSLNLIIIGEGEERANLQKLITDKKMNDRILLAGRIEDARHYLKAFDIFALTSRTEALPYSILEAGLAGLPVIASEVGGIPEVIDSPDKGILVPAGSVEEIKKSLLFLIKKSKYRQLASSNLKHQVQQHFSIKKMIEETTRLYAS